MVSRRGNRNAAAGAAAPAARTGGGPTERDDVPGGGDEAEPGDDGDGGGEPEGGEGPTVAELHRAWQDEIAFVKRLRQQGVQDGHPAMRAACEAREGAERAWRNAKEPAPAAIRLGRAQAKLDRAIELQADARQAILAQEQAHRTRMRELHAEMDDCTARVMHRRQQLNEVKAEVGASRGDGGTRSRQQEAIRTVHETICADVGPTIATLVEQLDTATPAWAALNGLLGKLSSSKQVLEGACQPQGDAQEFDIGDSAERWEETSDWSEGHDLRETGGGDAGGERDACGFYDHRDGDETTPRRGGWDGRTPSTGQDDAMDVSDWGSAPTRKWQAGSQWRTHGHGKWQRASWADQMEQDQRGDDGDGDDDQPAATRRRVGPADTQRATGDGLDGAQPEQQQQQQQQQQQERRRAHAERVNSVIHAAIEAGVNPVTPLGEDLHMLDPHQLSAWVAENMPEVEA